MEHIAIVGNGISGITTARHIRKLSDDTRITVISAETDHFFSRTALMYIYMGHMTYENTKPYEDSFWPKNRIDLKRGLVQSVDAANKQLVFSTGETMAYDKLVLACGSKSNKFGWPGQDLKGVQGLYNYQDLQLMEENSKNIQHAVLIGGGLIGVEMAEMLHTRGIKSTFLIRESRFWGNVLPKEEGELIGRHLDEHHVKLMLETELKEIVPDENGRVRAIITGSGEEIACQFVGLTAGVSPNIDFLKEAEIETQRGIMVNEYLETNVPGIYAVGDCAQFHQHPTDRRNLEQVWYTGRLMGETVARTICGDKVAYQPGVWFNSAKFFDIEYQTYGWVWNELKENEAAFYWEHPGGKMCLKMIYDKESHQLLGLNVFGVRMRHVVCESWLKENRSIEYAMEHLKDANFDPEFFDAYEETIVSTFNQQTGANVKVRQRSWKRILNL